MNKNKSIFLKKSSTLTFEIMTLAMNLRPILQKQNIKKIGKQISKKWVKKHQLLKRKKKQANLGKPHKSGLIFKTHNS